MNRATVKFGDYQNEVDNKEEELASLRARLHNKAEELKVAEIGALTNHNRANNFGIEMVEREEEVIQLKNEIQNLKQQLVEVQATRKSEGTALLEVEHIRADNDRLVKLLRKTEEYKSFGNFTENNSGSVRYLPTTKRNKCSLNNCKANTLLENVDPNIEEENWIPQEAFDVAYKFKNNNNGELSDVLINKLLQTLNIVWRERERKQIAKGKFYFKLLYSVLVKSN